MLWLAALACGLGAVGQGRPLVAGVVLGTMACAGLGFCLAGTLRALATLAAANGLYLVLLLLSGMVIPLDELPELRCATWPRALPSGALAEVVRGALTAGVDTPGRAWIVLAIWAVAAPRRRHPPLPLGDLARILRAER